LRDDEEEDTARHHPSAGMPQKYDFHPLVVGLSDFEIIGRIQIHEGQGVHPALHFQRIALHDFDAKFACLPGPVCIEFNAVLQSRSLVQDGVKRRTVSDAGIEGGERLCWKGKMASESLRFALGQRVKAEF
jgi:hypothetical protein